MTEYASADQARVSREAIGKIAAIEGQTEQLFNELMALLKTASFGSLSHERIDRATDQLARAINGLRETSKHLAEIAHDDPPLSVQFAKLIAEMSAPPPASPEPTENVIASKAEPRTLH